MLRRKHLFFDDAGGTLDHTGPSAYLLMKALGTGGPVSSVPVVPAARREAISAALRATPVGQPRLMGILNATPDSFHAASRVQGETAVRRGLAMLDAGATWVDVGGESTRPGATPVAVEEEVERVVGVLEELRKARPDAFLSVDTRRVEVARAALMAGADLINDVSGLRDPAMRELVLASGCGVCIMHMRGEPASMQHNIDYEDVVDEVHGTLHATALALVEDGHPSGLICLDPGIGFGKEHAHNLELLQAGDALGEDGRWSVLWGVSRKSVVGVLTGHADSNQRLAGTLGLAAVATKAGVDLLRVHDVQEHVDLLAAMAPFDLKA